MKLNYGSFLSVMETYYLDVQPYHAFFERQTTELSRGIRRQIMLLLSFTDAIFRKNTTIDESEGSDALDYEDYDEYDDGLIA